ncbi:hypothetical protein ZWY2020_033379 [Hordeum vulgare]|nr:hypothetical protein ZWY2020_033379 [Hordeum vulgare]
MFQKAGLQNEDLLAKIFEDLCNTGEDHWSPANGSMPQSPRNVDAEDHGDENEDKESEQEDESPVINNKGKRVGGAIEGKGKKSRSGSAIMQYHLKEIVELSKKSQAAIESIAKQREDASVCTIKDAMTLVTECGVVIGTNEHFIASEIFVKKEQREMFMTIPDASARFDWIQRKYDAKYGK